MTQDDDGSEVDEENEPGPSRKKRKQDQLDQVIANTEAIKQDIEQIKTSTRDTMTKLPLGLKGAIQEAFKCTICHQLSLLLWPNAAKAS